MQNKNSIPVRWGILGPGSIARRFAEGLPYAAGAKLVAVASRDLDKANAFADQYGAEHRHAGYNSLASDPEVDIVYIATPHSLHCENALLCIEQGKAVLCEKPFAINAAQSREMAAAAKKKNVFLMEGMWTRFFPAMAKVRELIAQGAIGEPRLLQADFGFRAGIDPHSRLFHPALGGGALLDVGVYPVSLAAMIFGRPDREIGLAHVGDTGVDEQAGIVLSYSGGRLAVLATAVRTNTVNSAVINGTEGRITIGGEWWKPSELTLHSGQTEQVIAMPYEGSGFQFEAEEANRCVLAGRTESEILPLVETIHIMQTMDILRAQWGVKYPMEP